jgi:uncharacterized protein (TIGR02466 family)
MITNHWFSVPVSHGYNKPLAESLVPIATEILADSNSMHSGLSRMAGERSKITLNQTNSRLDKRLDRVNLYFYNLCKKYLGIYGYDPNISLENSNLYFNDIGYGGHQATHMHNKSPVGGVFYLDVEDNSSDLKLEAPNEYMNYTFGDRLKTINISNIPQATYSPGNGMYVIFPGWLKHCVPTNYTKKRLALTFVYYYL